MQKTLVTIITSALLGIAMMCTAEKLPIFYHPEYNITCGGLETLSPFDTVKYGKIYRYLVEKTGIEPKDFSTVSEEVSEQTLKMVHSQEFLDLSPSIVTAMAMADPTVLLVPSYFINRCILRPMRLATQGTIEATKMALEKGYAFNLSGGYHHAKSWITDLGGFCIYADIPLAIKTVLTDEALKAKLNNKKILVIDLDAHRGNGVQDICGSDPALGKDKVDIFDMYGWQNYPGAPVGKEYVTYKFPLPSSTNTETYMKTLKEHLPSALEQTNPGLIIYNAGTDILEGDRVGDLQISAQGIIDRDAFVFKQAHDRKIPIVMVLSGGYTTRSAEIIGQSIDNVLKNVIQETYAFQPNTYMAPSTSSGRGLLLASCGLAALGGLAYAGYKWYTK